MKCSAARTFLSQINDRAEPITPITLTDLDYLSVNGYTLRTTKEDYEKGAQDVARLSQLTVELETEKAEERESDLVLQQDQSKEHSFMFHFEGKEEKEELRQRIQEEMAVASREDAELAAVEAKFNELIQKKSMIDRMVDYNGQYVSLTDLGTVVLNDLNVRNYRIADEEFPDFTAEIRTTYSMLRSISDKARSYVTLLKQMLPKIDDVEYSNNDNIKSGDSLVRAPSLFWGTAIGLGKLEGDASQTQERFIQALNTLQDFHSTTSNKLMAAEVMTALSSQDIQSLESVLRNLDQQLRNQDVPKELSAGVAATIMAGRRFDGTYPLDRFAQFRQITLSYEAAAILAVLNVPYEALSSKFQMLRSMFTSWGYMTSEDTEIASAFLAIGELNADEVQGKLKYIVEQLKNYLQYPLVAAAILASIPVFEAHEVLDLMEKAVTLLSAYSAGLERSETVALAVRMIHGVRNELVKEIDSTAKISETPVQFTYSPHPGLFFWYYPVIIAHSSYHSTFSGMGGFHPAHSHGVGGFAG
ncbi:MAG: hypothetical protein JRN52_15500 [Nitrososphaerota archaeon]|nr:hypothetical protein [Nitrososphaerota archaeon]